MDRRSVVRHAILVTVGMVLQKMDVVAISNRQLLVDMDQWQSVVFTLGKKKIVVSVQEIFESLQAVAK